MSVKLPFELDVERAKLGVDDMQAYLTAGEVDAFFDAGWATMNAIERAMQEVLTIKLGHLRSQNED